MPEINEKQFLENFQYFDKEVVLEIINIFLEEYPQRMETLQANIKERDFDQLRFNAHSLKGVVANFVAPEVQELAKTLELKGLNKDTEDLDTIYNELKTKADVMVSELKELKNHFK